MKPSNLLAVFIFLSLALAVAPLSVPQRSPEPISKIAFGSCNRPDLPNLIWKQLLTSPPDLWIWLGDVVYDFLDSGANDLFSSPSLMHVVLGIMILNSLRYCSYQIR